MKIYTLLVALLCATLGFAQQDALVFFTDKEDVATSIANPISILTQEAIDRKELHNTPIDERDVPVNEAYITSLKNEPGITVFAKSKWMNCAYVRGTQTDIENLEALSYVSSVEFADKSLNSFADTQPVPDKFALEQEPEQRIVYNYGATLNQTEQIAAEVLHQNDFTGEGMVVAVMDSGFPNFETIPAFSDIVNEGRLLGTYDFAERQIDVTGTGSHGTRTSSDIGGFIDGEFVGTAPNASFYLYRTEFAPSENPVEEAWWVEALERADSLGVDVVNTSLGYQDYDNAAYDHSYEDLDGQTTIAARGANHAFDKGMLLVTSAGNDGGGFTFVATPADAPGVLTIGAVDEDGNYVGFSSIGPTVDGRIKPDVMAKGASAAVINADGDVTTSSGTSFSSPIIAGTVTSLWQANPSATNAQVMQIVRESAHLFANPTDEMGYGIPNFGDALAALQLLTVEEQLLETQFAVYPNPVQDQLFVSFPKHLSEASVAVYSILGSKLMQQNISTQTNSIDLSHLSKGVYLISITAEENTNTFKIVKR